MKGIIQQPTLVAQPLSRIRLQDIAVVLVFIFFGMSGAIPGIAPNQANEMTGAAATGLQTMVGIGSQLLVNAGLLILLYSRRTKLLRTRAALLWPCLLAFWAIASTGWSQEPLLTARRAAPFALATGFGIFLAVCCSQRRMLALLQTALVLLACWSAVLALGFPAIGLDASTGHAGDWQGVFTQKNACGRAMVFALAAVLASGRVTLGRAAMLLLFTAELALSGSRGAWVLGALVAGALVVLRASCRLDRATRTALFAALAVAGACTAAAGTIEFAQLTPMLGRDATLTGRTAIWHEVWLAILNHPVLGYGFSAFWRGAQGASWSVVAALRFVVFHAHNGFLEIWLELGGAGLLLFVLGFARGAWLLWPELRAGRYAEAAWPLAVLLLAALYDVDENTLLSFNGLYWVLYAGALARVELLAAERRAVRGLLLSSAARRSQCRPCFHPQPALTPHSVDVSMAALFTDTVPSAAAQSPWL